MKHLRKFATEAEVRMSVLPNVVLIEESGKVLYNALPPNGAYIQDIQGALYTIAEWNAAGYTSDKANGVAVIDDSAQFVIAKDELTEGAPWCANTSSVIFGVTQGGQESDALKDFAGKENTRVMLTQGQSGAAYWCNSYLFPNGKNGYLPSAGEWKRAYKYRSVVVEAMALIGGATLNRFWTSTQHSDTRAWWYRWADNTLNNYLKTYNYPVRPFTTL